MSGKCGNKGNVYTAEDYLFGCVNFSVPADGARSILVNRGIAKSTLASELTVKDKELLKADLFVWICLGPSKVSSTSDSDNGWSHSGGGYTLSDDDKDRMLNYAYAIYDKYDEEIPFDDRANISVSSHGIMHCDYDCSGNPLPHTIDFP